MATPKVNSEGQKELDRAAERFEEFADNISKFNPCEVKAPLQETEPQTQLAGKVNAQMLLWIFHLCVLSRAIKLPGMKRIELTVITIGNM